MALQRAFARARTLGEGSFGCVCVVYDSETGRECAAKIFDADEFGDASAETLRELMILKSLGGAHPNIIGDVGFSTLLDEGETLFVTLPLLSGDVASALGWLSQRQKHRISHGIFCGLAYLHSRNVYHRDIKPENVLYTSDFEAKLIDFSLAKWVDEVCTSSSSDDGVTRVKNSRKKAKREAAAKKQRSSGEDKTTELLGTSGYIAPEMLRK